MPLLADTRYFKLAEFRHPELMNVDFVLWLNKVRFEYGYPMVLTSDGRTPAENAAASGSVPTSRHLVGEAIDMEFPPTANHLWLLVEAVMKTMEARPIELEIVHGPSDHHVHIAWLEPGRASSLTVSTD